MPHSLKALLAAHTPRAFSCRSPRLCIRVFDKAGASHSILFVSYFACVWHSGGFRPLRKVPFHDSIAALDARPILLSLSTITITARIGKPRLLTLFSGPPTHKRYSSATLTLGTNKYRGYGRPHRVLRRLQPPPSPQRRQVCPRSTKGEEGRGRAASPTNLPSRLTPS